MMPWTDTVTAQRMNVKRSPHTTRAVSLHYAELALEQGREHCGWQ